MLAYLRDELWLLWLCNGWQRLGPELVCVHLFDGALSVISRMIQDLLGGYTQLQVWSYHIQ